VAKVTKNSELYFRLSIICA